MAQKHGLTPPAALYNGLKETTNPFMEAREEWDRRTGLYVKRINRQSCANLVLGTAVLLLTLYAMLAPGKVVQVPYVIKQMEATGETIPLGLMPRGWDGKDTKPIDFVARLWLTAVREIPDSPVVWGLQWQRSVYPYMSATGQQKILNPYGLSRDAQQKRGETVQIQITSLLPITPDYKALTVEWIETTYTQQGMVKGVPDAWKAVLTITTAPPTTVETDAQLRNAFGIFVTDWSWAVKTSKGGT